MQPKYMGIVLSIAGIAGLALSLDYINGPAVNGHLALLMAAGIASAVVFFMGVYLFDRLSTRVPLQKIGVMSLKGMKKGKAALVRMKEEGVSAFIRVKDGQVALLNEGKAALMPANESQLQ
jgi:hypothetical protein